MATWQAIVGGTTYSLSDSNPFKILNISGIGNAPVRRLEERGPFQDGSTDVGYRLDARLINVLIQITGASLSATDGHRDTLSNIFNPRGGRTIYLRCTRDDGAVRQIDCYVVNMVDMPAELGQRDIASQRVAVQLKAPNPIWYNPTQVVTTFVPTVSTAWHLIGGLIGTADILTFGTAIGANVAWGAGSIAPGVGYSVVFRAAGSAVTNSLAWTFANKDDFMPYLVQLSAGTALIADKQYNHVFSTTSGTPVIIMTKVADTLCVYRDNTLIYSSPSNDLDGVKSNTGYWNPSPYTAWGTISHGAVYRKVLNSNERTALQNILTDGVMATTGETITNAGTWDEFPVISIPGPAGSPIVTNTSTGEVLDFTGATIPTNTSYIIDTRYGYKTVTDSNTVNQIDKLTDDSDLSTFHLVPGVNSIAIANAVPGGTVTITHYARYFGL